MNAQRHDFLGNTARCEALVLNEDSEPEACGWGEQASIHERDYVRCENTKGSARCIKFAGHPGRCRFAGVYTAEARRAMREKPETAPRIAVRELPEDDGSFDFERPEIEEHEQTLRALTSGNIAFAKMALRSAVKTIETAETAEELSDVLEQVDVARRRLEGARSNRIRLEREGLVR